jgi:hypothetical protein
MLQTLSNKQILTDAFQKHLPKNLNLEEQLDFIATRTGFNSWSCLASKFQENSVKDLEYQITSAINVEKVIRPHSVSYGSLRNPILKSLKRFDCKDERLTILKLTNLYLYTIHYKTFELFQKLTPDDLTLKNDTKPCFMVGYDLREFSSRDLHSQMTNVLSSLSDHYPSLYAFFNNKKDQTNFKGGINYNKALQSIVQFDQNVFRDEKKTKKYLVHYYMSITNELKSITPPESLNSKGITINAYNIEPEEINPLFPEFGTFQFRIIFDIENINDTYSLVLLPELESSLLPGSDPIENYKLNRSFIMGWIGCEGITLRDYDMENIMKEIGLPLPDIQTL